MKRQERKAPEFSADATTMQLVAALFSRGCTLSVSRWPEHTIELPEIRGGYETGTIVVDDSGAGITWTTTSDDPITESVPGGCKRAREFSRAWSSRPHTASVLGAEGRLVFRANGRFAHPPSASEIDQLVAWYLIEADLALGHASAALHKLAPSTCGELSSCADFPPPSAWESYDHSQPTQGGSQSC
jgi:hypothetical protein